MDTDKLKKLIESDARETYLKLNKALAEATSKNRKKVTLQNYEAIRWNYPTEEMKNNYKEYGITSKHWDNPKGYFESIRKSAISCNKSKDRFDQFLEDVVDAKYANYTDIYNQELTQMWKEILIDYILMFKESDLLYRVIKNQRGRKRAGAPLKIHLKIFIKLLNLTLMNLAVPRKWRRIGRAGAIQAFLKGYLNISREVEPIRQDLYR